VSPIQEEVLAGGTGKELTRVMAISRTDEKELTGSTVRRLLTSMLVATVLCSIFAFAAPSSPAGEAAAVGPPPPVGLEVFNRQEDLGLRVTLSWSHRPECMGYRVYRAGAVDGPYVCVGGISGETMADFPFFLDDTARGGNAYYYGVSALDASGVEGPQTVPVRAAPPVYYRTSAVGKSIVCSLTNQRVYFYENGVVVNILRCSTGASGTPTGNYHIMDHRGTVSSCNYWMDWRPNYGMHAWPSYLSAFEENLGVHPCSHGCIRLHPLEAYWPYSWAPDGTPLTVTYDSLLGGLPLQGLSCSSGATRPYRTWYFAEGFTGGTFLEYLVMFNPGAAPVVAKTTYYPEGAAPVTENYAIAAGSRYTVCVNNVGGLPRSGHATRVESEGGGIVAQQAEYFDYGGRRGGSATAGATRPSRGWYFAEAYTGPGFDTYLLLFNPDNRSALTTVTFCPEGAAPVTMQYDLPPLYRGTVLVNAVPGLAGKQLSFKVEAERAIVAERSEYFAIGMMPNGINGGDCTVGSPKPSTAWYLAEGSTAGFFDEYVLVSNTGNETANVDAVFYPPTGPYGYRFQVAPNSRGTVSVDSIPGLGSTDTGAVITSDRPIVVERALYCSRDSRRGGDTSPGVSSLSKDWYFAEGYTGGTFDEYILLLNPGDLPTTANMVFHTEGAGDVGYACGLPPRTRIAVHADDIPGVEWVGSAVEIHCDQPIAAEQSETFCIPR